MEQLNNLKEHIIQNHTISPDNISVYFDNGEIISYTGVNNNKYKFKTTLNIVLNYFSGDLKLIIKTILEFLKSSTWTLPDPIKINLNSKILDNNTSAHTLSFHVEEYNTYE